MNSRLLPARLALVLLAANVASVPMAHAGTASKTNPATVAEEPATSPPMPALSPAQTYRPLNFYSRDELKQFGVEVPYVAPWCNGAFFAPPLPKLPGDENGVDSPVYVAADEMQLDEDGESRMSGGVEVRQGQNLMHADTASISGGREVLHLIGHVVVQDPAMTLEADNADLTLDGSGSKIVNARYALHAAHVRGSAGSIERANTYSVSITDGAYTTCEPGHDVWALAADNIHLDQESGWGNARHVKLLVQNKPVLYVPYIAFPIDKRRQSGVLYPTFSITQGNGLDIAVPYYFNLAPQYDLLLTPRLIEKRGAMAEAELRYLHGSPTESWGRGSLGIGVIPDDNAYGGQERHVIRFRHEGDPVPAVHLFADATTVSDNDYLDDVSSQLSVNRDSHLVRVAQTRWTSDNSQALLRVQGWQTIDPTIAPVDQPYRRVPQILLATQMPLHAGIEASGSAELVYFDRLVQTAPLANPVGARARLEPSLWLPLHGAAWRVDTQARLRNAFYSLNDNPADETPSRAIPTLSSDASVVFERDLNWRGTHATQTLEPRVYALYTPYRDQDNTPLFDTTALTFGYDELFRDNRFAGGDRVGDAQQVSLALESRLLGSDGGETARFGIGQAIYAGDRRVQLTPATPADTDPRSPLVANVGFQPAENTTARLEGQWSATSSEFVRGSVRLNWQDERLRTLNVAWRYDAPTIDQAELSGMYPVDPDWNIVGRWLYDIGNSRAMEALGGVEYESCCWRARVLARRTVDIDATTAQLVADQGIVFEIELKGLGSLGDQISSELAQSIPGYANRKKTLR